MLYLMAKDDCYDYFSNCSVVKNELITIKEYARKCPYISTTKFYRVQINKNHTYISFGVRFPVSEALIHFNKDGRNFIFIGQGTRGKLYDPIVIK